MSVRWMEGVPATLGAARDLFIAALEEVNDRPLHTAIREISRNGHLGSGRPTNRARPLRYADAQAAMTDDERSRRWPRRRRRNASTAPWNGCNGRCARNLASKH